MSTYRIYSNNLIFFPIIDYGLTCACTHERYPSSLDLRSFAFPEIEMISLSKPIQSGLLISVAKGKGKRYTWPKGANVSVEIIALFFLVRLGKFLA